MESFGGGHQDERRLQHVENQLGALAQDIKILEAGFAVLSAYRNEMMDARLRDRVTTMESGMQALKDELHEVRKDTVAQTHRLEDSFKEEARKTRRWVGYLVTLSAAFIGAGGSLIAVILTHH